MKVISINKVAPEEATTITALDGQPVNYTHFAGKINKYSRDFDNALKS